MAKIVIVGASCAGHAVATRLREMRQDCQVILVTEEKYPVYDRRRLLDFAAGSIKEKDLFLCANDFYQQRNIDFFKDSKVSSINTNKKTIHFKNRESLEYDFLVICSGRNFLLPEIPGVKKNGVFRLYSLSDSKNFHQYGSGDSVCIVGSGLSAERFALELAAKQKKEVKLISVELLHEARVTEPALAATAHNPDLLVSQEASGQPEASAHVERIQSRVIEIIGESSVQAVKLSEGKIICASSVVFMDELKSNIDFLKNADIAIKDDFIEVDAGMRTCLQNVFACGTVCMRQDAARGVKTWEEVIAESKRVVESLIQALGN
ncbi:MAG: NAD(P)/FAD-dependent oxidoreductase [Candidatus Omnitrophota bacterium]|jgi:nitrite reductase (NADH) large subunit